MFVDTLYIMQENHSYGTNDMPCRERTRNMPADRATRTGKPQMKIAANLEYFNSDEGVGRIKSVIDREGIKQRQLPAG